MRKAYLPGKYVSTLKSLQFSLFIQKHMSGEFTVPSTVCNVLMHVRTEFGKWLACIKCEATYPCRSRSSARTILRWLQLTASGRMSVTSWKPVFVYVQITSPLFGSQKMCLSKVPTRQSSRHDTVPSPLHRTSMNSLNFGWTSLCSQVHF